MCFCCCGTVFIPDNYCTMIHRFRLLTNQKILLKIIQNLFQQLIVFCSQYYWITGDNSYNSNDDYSVALICFKNNNNINIVVKTDSFLISFSVYSLFNHLVWTWKITETQSRVVYKYQFYFLLQSHGQPPAPYSSSCTSTSSIFICQ